MLKKIVQSLIAFFPLVVLASCASVRSSFIQDAPIITQPKEDLYEVEYLYRRPEKASLRIGLITTNGNGFASFDDLIKEARIQAAELGGDFILAENSGVETQTSYSPGYSTYQSNSYASYGSHSGHGNSYASAYSVGPSISTANFPWCIFSVWVYRPSSFGFWLDEGFNVSEFHLNSDAKKSGLKIGDKVIGIDGYDIHDQKLLEHIMTIHTDDKVRISIERGSKPKEIIITAIPN